MSRTVYSPITAIVIVVALSVMGAPSYWYFAAQKRKATFPAWATGLIGKSLADTFKTASKCIGYTDGVMAKYVDGVRIRGWAWDLSGSEPIHRIVLTNPNGKIVGAGEGGYDRLDVSQANARITSDSTGWEADIQAIPDRVSAFGLINENTSACPVGSANSQ